MNPNKMIISAISLMAIAVVMLPLIQKKADHPTAETRD